jgi:hypothetical protein
MSDIPKTPAKSTGKSTLLVSIGIDPGASGAIAAIYPGGIHSYKLKGATERDIADILIGYAVGNPGVLRGVLAAINSFSELTDDDPGIPFVTERPAVWLAEFKLKRRPKETPSQWKNRHKACAQELFPGVKITHANADALLLAEYARRLRLRLEV